MTEPADNEQALLARIDERTAALQREVAQLRQELRDEYVRRSEFVPVRNVVYGLVALVLSSVAGAIIAIVVRGMTND